MHISTVSEFASVFRRYAFKVTVLLGAGLLFGDSVSAAPASHPDTTGWKRLIANNLANVNIPVGSWELKDDVLVAKTHDTLWTKESYDNFILDLEFKVAKESNSGVFLRSGNTKDALSALEVQVHDSEDGALYGMVGAIYNALPYLISLILMLRKHTGAWALPCKPCKPTGPLRAKSFSATGNLFFVPSGF